MHVNIESQTLENFDFLWKFYLLYEYMKGLVITENVYFNCLKF